MRFSTLIEIGQSHLQGWKPDAFTEKVWSKYSGKLRQAVFQYWNRRKEASNDRRPPPGGGFPL
jgi:hypothetical protein